jgi:hypothetical protein
MAAIYDVKVALWHALILHIGGMLAFMPILSHRPAGITMALGFSSALNRSKSLLES